MLPTFPQRLTRATVGKFAAVWRGSPLAGTRLPALFMNAAQRIPAEVCPEGEAFSGPSQTGMFARSPQGRVHGVPEKASPSGRASAHHDLTPFMNNACEGFLSAKQGYVWSLICWNFVLFEAC